MGSSQHALRNLLQCHLPIIFVPVFGVKSRIVSAFSDPHPSRWVAQYCTKLLSCNSPNNVNPHFSSLFLSLIHCEREISQSLPPLLFAHLVHLIQGRSLRGSLSLSSSFEYSKTFLPASFLRHFNLLYFWNLRLPLAYTEPLGFRKRTSLSWRAPPSLARRAKIRVKHLPGQGHCVQSANLTADRVVKSWRVWQGNQHSGELWAEILKYLVWLMVGPSQTLHPTREPCVSWTGCEGQTEEESKKPYLSALNLGFSKLPLLNP